MGRYVRRVRTEAAAHLLADPGATTINQYLAAGLLDELRLHIVPFTLGAGVRLFEGVPPLNLEQLTARAASSVLHVTYRVLP
ncbi:dihydrofolate reductase family protein [Micromonospora sp. NPDC005220]|uniref:dihydrofolate reductase family protein n=1 Tax=Micromonospora sp. NPDC005220 TaxID=3155589 RepID=UPI0033A27764